MPLRFGKKIKIRQGEYDFFPTEESPNLIHTLSGKLSTGEDYILITRRGPRDGFLSSRETLPAHLRLERKTRNNNKVTVEFDLRQQATGEIGVGAIQSRFARIMRGQLYPQVITIKNSNGEILKRRVEGGRDNPTSPCGKGRERVIHKLLKVFREILSQG